MVEVENMIEDIAVKPIEQVVENTPKMLERISALEAYLQALFSHFHAKDPANPPPAPSVIPYPGPPPELPEVAADDLNAAELASHKE